MLSNMVGVVLRLSRCVDQANYDQSLLKLVQRRKLKKIMSEAKSLEEH
jgi:hypothetical protein